MSVYRISYRYANSLFQIAEEKKSLKKLADDAELIFSTLEKSKELKSFLKNPVIKPKEKKNILAKIFKEKVNSDMMDFLDFVIDKNREDILMEIMREFLNLRDNKEGILRAKIISAVELSDSLKKEIESKLEVKEQKKVISQFIIDPNIIGGFVIKFGDTVIDASLTHQLKRLRKKFFDSSNELGDINISNN